MYVLIYSFKYRLVAYVMYFDGGEIMQAFMIWFWVKALHTKNNNYNDKHRQQWKIIFKIHST